MEWFGLAKELGGMTVAELRSRMSIDEFHHWCAYYEILHEDKPD